MEVMNFEISPYCSAGHSAFYTNEALGIKNEIVPFAKTETELVYNMKTCFQFENVDMYEHGLMVNREYTNILYMLQLGLVDEVFPPELLDIFKTHTLLPLDVMSKYQILHDCGKPLCLKVDEQGRRQYPNHAFISYQQVLKLFPLDSDLQYLVLHDMDFHTLKNEELESLAKSKYGFSLYLTAWAELIANSQMFGGYDNVSFKIKRKKLIKSLKLFRDNK
jgi:hypothetical protein